MEINTFINMLKEFDYKKNGKLMTIYFLARMIQYFNELDEKDFK